MQQSVLLYELVDRPQNYMSYYSPKYMDQENRFFEKKKAIVCFLPFRAVADKLISIP